MTAFSLQAWCVQNFLGDADTFVVSSLPDYAGASTDDGWWIPGTRDVYFDGNGGAWTDGTVAGGSTVLTLGMPAAPNAKQFVSARVHKLSAPNAGSWCGVCARAVGTTCYALVYDSTTDGWKLVKQVAAVNTVLATYSGAGQGIAIGAQGSCILYVNGTTLQAITNGVVQTPVTDAAVAGPGCPGLVLMPTGGTLNDATGLHLEGFLAAYVP